MDRLVLCLYAVLGVLSKLWAWHLDLNSLHKEDCICTREHGQTNLKYKDDVENSKWMARTPYTKKIALLQGNTDRRIANTRTTWKMNGPMNGQNSLLDGRTDESGISKHDVANDTFFHHSPSSSQKNVITGGWQTTPSSLFVNKKIQMKLYRCCNLEIENERFAMKLLVPCFDTHIWMSVVMDL